MHSKPVLFDQALFVALEKVKFAPGIGETITLVRDLRGRIRLLAPGREEDSTGEAHKNLTALCETLSKSLGCYGFPPERMVLFSEDLAPGDSAALTRDRLLLSREQGRDIFLLDRQITGQDWLKESFTRATSTPRVTFYGVKGGVGRSTALVVWALRLAKQGKKVLIFDLDLESPGVSSTLLSKDSLSDFGVADWFVEDGVGQAGAVESEMVATSPLARGQNGDILVVPAYGRKTGDYLPKLARCYAHTPSVEEPSWGDRLSRMVTGFEKSHTPDVVILDSRAGIHDIAAAAVTRMGAQAFLFAVESAQTWSAYAFLFRHWKSHPGLDVFRRKLQIVASMIPETGREAHLKRFREHSWDLFREGLYDAADPTDIDAFSFDLNDAEAPHYPLSLFWNRALQEFAPLGAEGGMDEQTVKEAMGESLLQMDRLVFADGEGD